MARPPIPPGEHGTITVTEVRPRLYRARCRYRDPVGRMRFVERTGPNKTAARKALTDTLKAHRPIGIDDTRPHYAKFSTAVELYRAELVSQVADGRLRPTTAMRYQSCLARIDRGLGALRIPELTSGRIALFLADLQREGLSADSRRTHRAVLANVLRLLTEHDVVTPNLMTGLRRITGTRKTPRALTPEERRRLLAWCDTDTRAQRRGLGDFVRFMLGTGCRIGEALAIRWQDVDLVGVPLNIDGAFEQVPVVAITGNIVEVKGAGVVRHPGKTKSSLRVIPLPPFIVDMLRMRKPADAEPWHPIFAAITRAGEVGYKRPSLMHGWIREMRDELGMSWLSSHTFRKTSATVLHDAGLPDRVIAGMTGHADLTTLLNVYIGRGELNPQIALALESGYREGA